MRETVASLDLGSTWVKAAVFATDGKMISLSRRPAPGQPGEAGRFDAEGYFSVVLEVLREAVEIARTPEVRIDGIVCASQRATAVIVDGQGAAMAPAVSWMAPMVDGRPVLRALSEEAFRALTGLPGWPMFPVFRLAAGEEPLRGAVDRGGRLLSLGDFVLGRLGGPLVTEPSLAAATGCLDGRLRRWDPGLVRLAGLGQMPPIVAPGTPVGALGEGVSSSTGLPRGVPLIVGGSDQACALLGSGITGPGEALLSLGTAAVVVSPVMGWPPATPSTVVLPHVLGDQWVAEGFVGAFGSALDRIAAALGLGTAVGLAAAAVLRPPVEGSALFLWNRWRAVPTVPELALVGGPDTPVPDPAAVAALVVESLGFELALALESVAEVTSVDRLRVAGGGTRGRALVEGIVAALGRPVLDTGTPEAALRGAALLAIGALVGGGSGGVVPGAPGLPDGSGDRVDPRPEPWRESRYLRYRAWKEREMTRDDESVEGGSIPTQEEMDRIREEAMDLANVGIYRYRMDGTLVFMDRGALRLLDVEKDIKEPSELYGKKLADLLVYLDEPGSLRRQTLERGFVKNLEYHYRTLKGEERWAQHTAYLVHNRETREPEIQVLSRDITDLKRTASALEASERRLRALIERSPQGILVLEDGSLRPLLVNRTLLRLLGRSGDGAFEAREEDVIRWFHPEDRPRVEACLREMAPSGLGDAVGALRLMGEKGRLVWVDLQVSELRFDQAPARQVTLTDVTARIEDERRRKELEVRMQEARRLESLAVLAGGVAHDFNNLLAAIMGNTEFLRERAEGDPDLACHVEEISAATERAAELCRQLLAYSGRRILQRAPLDLNRLVEDSMRLVEFGTSREVVPILELAPGLLAVEGDASQLSQVIVNLTVNALEALGDGGVVRIRTGVESLGRVGERRFVQGDQPAPGTYVYLEVKDDGCGMTEEVLGRVFEPFFTTKFTGRGLGMAAVRGIVRGHGGAFELESRPGEGTSVRVWFPARAGSVPPEKSPTPTPVDWRGEGTALLADDEPAPRGITARLLAALGFEPVLASGGPEAVRRFEEDPSRFR